ncbi:uncharacterized protein LOC126561109 [Anopheles maculipalpis]|uniref:uncharacterized protein LOC126561109 n=1 Tax=Anopheles maculipalpis TaxID=1496333 RepID=UPI00215932E2|nr:uncharacterized protein LOC126561109 [Anopheles maculipalpis]
MQRASGVLFLFLTFSHVLWVFSDNSGPKFGSFVTFGAKTANLNHCYSSMIQANVFSLLPITRIVTFTPKMYVKYITVSSKTSSILSAKIVQGGVDMDGLRPISVALTSDLGGRLSAEINAYCR